MRILKKEYALTFPKKCATLNKKDKEHLFFMKKRILLFLISLLSIVCFALGFTSCNAPTENSVDPFMDNRFLYEHPSKLTLTWRITGLAPEYENLTEITIPNYYDSHGVAEIGPFAFSGNTNLKKVIINARLDTIGEYAFYGCTALEEVVVGEGVDFIHQNAFLDCASLKSVTFPENSTLRSIGSSAFENTGLEEIELPSSLISIYENAFYNSKLTKIRIPSSVGTIEDNAFYTETLQETHIESLKSFSAIEFSSEKANPTYYTKNLFLNGEEIKSLVLPDDCYLVKDFAFTSLTLDGIHIGSNTLTIYEGAFAFATRLGEITVSEKNPNYEAIDNCLIQKKNPESKTLVTTTQSTTVIPQDQNITRIGAYAFANHALLTEIIIPDTVKEISTNAFMNCPLLYTVQLPANLETIQPSAFYDCVRLDNVIFPTTLKFIGAEAFYNCKALSSVRLENTRVGSAAFGNCFNLLIVYLKNVEKLPNRVFMNCIRLQVIHAENTTLVDTAAFLGCSKINEANFQITNNTNNLTVYQTNNSTLIAHLVCNRDILYY